MTATIDTAATNATAATIDVTAARHATAAGATTPPGDHRLTRVGAILVLVALVLLLTVGIGRVGAEAELADPVTGHAVVEPGSSLWAVAVDTAPAGVDPRAQLDAIRDLNGIDGSEVAAWTVVLLPAR